MPVIKKLVFDKTTILTNEFLQNENITLEAKGLLGYMLSLPNNWDFTIAGIADKTNTSEYKITKILHELEANGYHTKKHVYKNGRIKDWVYYIFAEPRQDIIDKTFDITISEQELDLQDVEKQDSCFSSDKQTISNKLDIEYKTKEIGLSKDNAENNVLENSKKKQEPNRHIEIYNFLKEYLENKDEDIKEAINKYVKMRKNIFKGGKLTVDKLKGILKQFDEDYKNAPKDAILIQLNRATNLQWSVISFEPYRNPFKGTLKTSYSSQPTFDNTKGNVKIHHISDEEFNKLSFEDKMKEMEKFDAIANMTKNQQEFFNQHCLARDENGNLIKF